MKDLRRSSIFLGLAAAVLAGFAAWHGARPAVAYPGADNLRLIDQACDGFGDVTARFTWQNYNQGDAWLDVSNVNGDFVWDQFYGHGPFTLGQNVSDRGGLVPNAIYYVRVNTAVFPFWVPSNMVVFQTRSCAATGPVAGSPLQTCDTFGDVTARFNWQSLGGGDQWLDLSTIGPNFDWGTFIGEGPFTPDRNSADRGGLLPNTVYFVRINTAVFPYWVPSPIFSFRTISCTAAVPTATPTLTPVPTATIPAEPTPPH